MSLYMRPVGGESVAIVGTGRRYEAAVRYGRDADIQVLSAEGDSGPE